MSARPSLIFVADMLRPRLGMARALEQVADQLSLDFDITVVTIAGDEIEGSLGHAKIVHLAQSRGFLGRLGALCPLRALPTEAPRSHVVTVGIWATVTYLIATVGRKQSIILWEHSLLPWRLRNEPKVLIAALLLRLVGRRVRQTIAVSDATARTVQAFLPRTSAVTVIPNFIPLGPTFTEVQPRKNDGAPTSLVGIGALTKVKNWQLAIRSMVHLPSTVRLTLAGEGPLLGELKELTASLGVADRVEFAGYVSDVPSLLKGADVVVHPAHAETFGYTLVEAAQACRPVVTLPRAVMNEFVPRLVRGTLAKGVTSKAFAEAVTTTLQALETFDYDGALQSRSEEMSHAHVLDLWTTTLDLGPSNAS